jgi:hypothetical protein
MNNIIENPVITGDFKPKFYWTGNPFEDAKRINQPHIKKEGENENRITETQDILTDLGGFKDFSIKDILNIQNRLLSKNNWKGVKAGFRTHSVNLSTVDYNQVEEYTNKLFPVAVMPKEQLLEWYRQIQLVHPLSDLNGRVFGIIVSVLFSHNK